MVPDDFAFQPKWSQVEHVCFAFLFSFFFFVRALGGSLCSGVIDINEEKKCRPTYSPP